MRVWSKTLLLNMISNNLSPDDPLVTLAQQDWVKETGQQVLNLAKENEVSIQEAFNDLLESILEDFGKRTGRQFGRPRSKGIDFDSCSDGELGAMMILQLEMLGWTPPTEP